jgi:hypothetical protein
MKAVDLILAGLVSVAILVGVVWSIPQPMPQPCTITAEAEVVAKAIELQARADAQRKACEDRRAGECP